MEGEVLKERCKPAGKKQSAGSLRVCNDLSESFAVFL